MRCARCHRDTATVEEREPPYCPSILCDVCYEYEKSWYAFKLASGDKDSAEFWRLSNRLTELSERIDALIREAYGK